MFYVSIIFQNVQFVFTWGGGRDPEKNLDIGGGRRFEKKMEIFKFSPIPPLSYIMSAPLTYKSTP